MRRLNRNNPNQINNRELEIVNIIRNVYIAFLSLLLTTSVVSCASNSILAPVESAETVTGSRVAEDNFRDDAVAMRSMQRVARSPMMQRSRLEEKPLKENKIISWKPSTQADNNAVIKLGTDESIKPKSIEVSLKIDGFRARVVIDGIYRNPHNRSLEGSFKFRLPSGAVPYFFAFGETKTLVENSTEPAFIFEKTSNWDNLSPINLMGQRENTWSAPRQAIMVAKEKAAFAYNETVARKIDPALLEWSGAGVFSAKVFPLQAHKSHRVVIGYDLDLQRVGSDLLLDLPLTYEPIKKRIKLMINRKGSSRVVINRIVKDQMNPEELISKNNEHNQNDIDGTLLNGLRISIKEHANVALVGEDEIGGYFAKRWLSDLPVQLSKSSSHVVFALDTSLSASPEKFHQWVKLIDKILENNQQEIEYFSLLSFNIDPHWWKNKFIANNRKQRSRLSKYLNRLTLEGATDLAAGLAEAASPQWLKKDPNAGRYDLFLLSDGAATWGEKDAFFISAVIKKLAKGNHSVNQLFSYRLGTSGENAGLLAHLSREIGGASYQLSDEFDIEKLSLAHRMKPWKIESIGGSGLSDIIIKGRPSSIYPGQLLTIAGRIDQSFEGQLTDSIVLSISKDGVFKRIVIPAQQKIDSKLTARIYGQIAVSQLESIGLLETKVASAYANHFRVPGKSSSLLMLETSQDYARYQIKPEQDEYVVKVKFVTRLFKALTEEFAQRLSDPKMRLLGQIKMLEEMDFLKFTLPNSVKLLFEGLSMKSFELADVRDASKRTKKSSAGRKYLGQIETGEINYLEVQKEAERRYKRVGSVDALKVWSSLVEQTPSDVAILRDVAFAAESWGLYRQAYQLHLSAAVARPFEPQSYTYLAKLAEKMGRSDLALIYFEIGLASDWQSRFGDYSLIHKVDYANFLRKRLNQKSKQDFFSREYAELKFESLKHEINLQGSKLIIAISWNTDRTDIDLHVVEPSGEECFYSHNKTRTGGLITRDVTQGYGPEMYVNKNAPKGKYDLFVKYYASDRNKLGLKTKVLVRTIRDWGTDQETEKVQSITLVSQQEKQRIAKIRL